MKYRKYTAWKWLNLYIDNTSKFEEKKREIESFVFSANQQKMLLTKVRKRRTAGRIFRAI